MLLGVSVGKQPIMYVTHGINHLYNALVIYDLPIESRIPV